MFGREGGAKIVVVAPSSPSLGLEGSLGSATLTARQSSAAASGDTVGETRNTAHAKNVSIMPRRSDSSKCDKILLDCFVTVKN